MRFVFAIVVLMVFAGSGLAGDDAARSQVHAATKDAISNLMDEVSRTPLTRSLSVGEFIRRTNSADEVSKALQRAQQIGGPRWVDDHTCQIELQISGPVVAQALQRAAAANARRSPLSAGELERAVKDWDERSFSATGSATSKLPVVKRRAPKIGLQRDPWWDVSEAAREQTVAAAKADAGRRALSSVKSMPLTPKSTVADVLAVKDVAEGMQKWFVSQPAASVELHDDLEAEVEVAVTPTETYKAFRVLAVKQKEVALPTDEQGWGKLKELFEQRMSAPIGRAVVAGDGGGVQAVAAVKPLGLPADAPGWVGRRLEASGNGAPGKSKLLSARAAESAAEEKLRKQIEDLPLKGKQTIGQAAKDDPRVGAAIDRALVRARIGKADYHDNGSADVGVYLDLSVVWTELLNAE